ncbi:MAG: hypothetical protein KatS3mg082_0500 [Nitrospiraceae bacterium]|nr:MAG: hypothetical protein KatS3mg082_0500 [Nitrospiraceae bacterium]
MKLLGHTSIQSALVTPFRVLPKYCEMSGRTSIITLPPASADSSRPAWIAAVHTEESSVYTSVPHTGSGVPPGGQKSTSRRPHCPRHAPVPVDQVIGRGANSCARSAAGEGPASDGASSLATAPPDSDRSADCTGGADETSDKHRMRAGRKIPAGTVFWRAVEATIRLFGDRSGRPCFNS